MEKLTLELHAAMSSVYRAPRNVWLVRTPSCKSSTINALYKMGMIETDRVFQGKVLRFKITDRGNEYGQQYCRPNQRTTDNKNK